MSDPVTNVEIEDVLSSIRRLVSDGDKARTRDPAPVAQAEQQPDMTQGVSGQDDVAAQVEADKPAKLVLTPALMVVGTAPEPEEANEPANDGWFESEPSDLAHQDDAHQDDAHQDDTHQDDDISDEAEEEHAAEAGEPDDQDAEPLHLSDALVEDGPAEMTAQEDPEPNEEVFGEQDDGPDRSELVATIAELEAAISDDTDEFEPDGSETTMGQTITWPGATVRDADGIEDAETVEDDVEAEASAAEVIEDVSVAEPAEYADELDDFDDDDDDIDDFEDDDLDGLLDAGGVAIDEAALRELVADVVREELTGPMGERITRNVRKLVRREIYRILSSQDFD